MTDGVEPDRRARTGLRSLGQELHHEALRSSTRVLILLSLGLNGRLAFTDLLELTRVGKGSLSYHIDRLVLDGLIESGMVFTLDGPRIMVSISPKGIDSYRRIVGFLTELSGPALGASERGNGRPDDSS